MSLASKISTQKRLAKTPLPLCEKRALPSRPDAKLFRQQTSNPIHRRYVVKLPSCYRDDRKPREVKLCPTPRVVRDTVRPRVVGIAIVFDA